MHDDIIEAPPGDIPVDLAIWLSPLQTWRSVYGNGFCDEAMRACVERLTGCLLYTSPSPRDRG